MSYGPRIRTTMALGWVTKKLRHYTLIHTVHMVTPIDPIRYFLQQSVRSGKVARCTMMLLEFDLHYTP